MELRQSLGSVSPSVSHTYPGGEGSPLLVPVVDMLSTMPAGASGVAQLNAADINESVAGLERRHGTGATSTRSAGATSTSASSATRAQARGRSPRACSPTSAAGNVTTPRSAASDGLSVNRYVPTARPAQWGTDLQKTGTSPWEELPKIETRRKSKFDHLSEGRGATNSPVAAKNASGGQLSSNAAAARRESYGRSPARSMRTADMSDVSTLEAAPRERVENVIVPRLVPAPQHEGIVEFIQSIDFPTAVRDLAAGRRAAADAGKVAQLLKIISADGKTVRAEDVHALLLAATPTGVALQEAVDFLWEECDHRKALSLKELASCGDRLRDRVTAFSHFSVLDNSERIRDMYERVFPTTRLAGVGEEEARLQLVREATRTATSSSRAPRALRVYEIMFLADLNDSLYRRGLLTASQVAGIAAAADRAIGGDLLADVLLDAGVSVRAEARRAAPAPAEEVQWGDGGTDTHEYPAQRAHSETSSGRGRTSSATSSAPSQPPATRTPQKPAGKPPGGAGPARGRARQEQRGAAGGAGSRRGSSARSPGTVGPSVYTLTHRPKRRARRVKEPFHLERRLKPDHVTYLGPSIEQGHIDRVKQDTQLLFQLQASYLQNHNS